jgi:hypothetical protein
MPMEAVAETDISWLNEHLLVRVLQCLDSHRHRAQLACVSRAWRSAVQRSWTAVHLCFDTHEALLQRMAWLSRQLQDCPQLLRSVELHCSTPAIQCPMHAIVSC